MNQIARWKCRSDPQEGGATRTPQTSRTKWARSFPRPSFPKRRELWYPPSATAEPIWRKASNTGTFEPVGLTPLYVYHTSSATRHHKSPVPVKRPYCIYALSHRQSLFKTAPFNDPHGNSLPPHVCDVTSPLSRTSARPRSPPPPCPRAASTRRRCGRRRWTRP